MIMQALPNGVDSNNDLLNELSTLYDSICLESDKRLTPYRARYPTGFTTAARNLADYLALRSHDLRPLQQRLVNAGLSSLGRGESQVRVNLERVIRMLGRTDVPETGNVSSDNGALSLESSTGILFGERNRDRYARIMVTLPAEAATQPELIRQLVANGMDCARINCAHDDRNAWTTMIENVRAVAAESGKTVRIFMDLAGHKIRTGSIRPGPSVLHSQVHRDEYGHLTETARLLLTADPSTVRSSLPCLPIERELFDQLRAGHSLHFRDTRDKYRVLQTREPAGAGAWLAECEASAYIVPGTPLRWQGMTEDGEFITSDDYRIGEFTGKPQNIRLFRGDYLLLRRDCEPGMAASVLPSGVSNPAQIGCSHPDIVALLHPGDSLWIDDGKLGCIVTENSPQGALLQVSHAGPKGVRIQSGKGINLPDTDLPLPALTEKDCADLDFICANADMVGFSFVRKLEDVDVLRHELSVRNRSSLPIVLKIETAAAVKNLPDLLLGTMGKHAVGVMIARGDLAIELGSVRMAEIQEEILWICEAAHVPVIWATQVLDTLARKGVIARPEITDAAMSVRAECVMLNKGAYIGDAVSVLDNILTRMDAHQYKKVSRLRRLHW
jgi:pyruvate kinase